MKISTLEHYNIRTERLAETIAFYTSVLEFTEGVRPGNPPPNSGAWLMNANNEAVVHIAAVDRNDPVAMARLTEVLGHRDLDSLSGGGAIDHVAFLAEGFEEVLDRCSKLGVPARSRSVPNTKVRQVFLTDPNGISVELNFRGG
jgi:catechol 2,3-dioxygenase-like lactoylglutathione lyase family enzyme